MPFTAIKVEILDKPNFLLIPEIVSPERTLYSENVTFCLKSAAGTTAEEPSAFNTLPFSSISRPDSRAKSFIALSRISISTAEISSRDTPVAKEECQATNALTKKGVAAVAMHKAKAQLFFTKKSTALPAEIKKSRKEKGCLTTQACGASENLAFRRDFRGSSIDCNLFSRGRIFKFEKPS